MEGLVPVLGVAHCPLQHFSSWGWLKGIEGKTGDGGDSKETLRVGILPGKGKSWEVASNSWRRTVRPPPEGGWHTPILSDSRRRPATLPWHHPCLHHQHHQLLCPGHSSRTSSCRWQAAVVLLDICSEHSPFWRCRRQLIPSPYSSSPVHSPQTGILGQSLPSWSYPQADDRH